MTDHELKCWTEYFEAILDGSKVFEVRKDDRGFREGDTLRLREYVPPLSHRHDHNFHHHRGEYTGREVRARIGYVLRGSCAAIPDFDGHVVFSLLDVTSAAVVPSPDAPAGTSTPGPPSTQPAHATTHPAPATDEERSQAPTRRRATPQPAATPTQPTSLPGGAT